MVERRTTVTSRARQGPQTVAGAAQQGTRSWRTAGKEGESESSAAVRFVGPNEGWRRPDPRQPWGRSRNGDRTGVRRYAARGPWLGIRRAEGFWRLGVRFLQFPFVTLTFPVMAYSVLVSPCKLRGCRDISPDVVPAQGLNEWSGLRAEARAKCLRSRLIHLTPAHLRAQRATW